MQKWLITVELLLGDIPERAMFLEKENRKCLIPYYQLTLGTCISATAHGDPSHIGRDVEKLLTNLLPTELVRFF